MGETRRPRRVSNLRRGSNSEHLHLESFTWNSYRSAPLFWEGSVKVEERGMLRGVALVVVLGLGLNGGCVSGINSRTASFFRPLRPAAAPAGVDECVLLDVAVIEQPL